MFRCAQLSEKPVQYPPLLSGLFGCLQSRFYQLATTYEVIAYTTGMPFYFEETDRPATVSPLTRIRLMDLREQPQWLDTLAKWHQQQWPESNLNDRREKLKVHLKENSLPFTFILLIDNELCGSASIVQYRRLGGLPASLWLTNVYIHEPYRRQRLGSLLIRSLQRWVSERGYFRLYLCTVDQMSFYHRLGWSSLQQKQLNNAMTTMMVWHSVDSAAVTAKENL